MNWLDIVMLVVIIAVGLAGLKVGLIKALLVLVGIVVGIVLAGRYYGLLVGYLSFIPSSSLARIAAFAIILVVVLVIAIVLATILKWVASAVMMGWVNRLGGAVFGLVLGAIGCAALLAIWVKFMGISWLIKESALAALLLDNFPMVLKLLPSEFDPVRSFFR